jgi:hypothetical protein
MPMSAVPMPSGHVLLATPIAAAKSFRQTDDGRDAVLREQWTERLVRAEIGVLVVLEFEFGFPTCHTGVPKPASISTGPVVSRIVP